MKLLALLAAGLLGVCSAGHGPTHELQLVKPENIRFAPVGVGAPAYSVSVSPTLINNDDYVTVTVSSTQPAPGDWVGAYSPFPPSDPRKVVPVKWIDLWSASTPYQTTGRDAINITMVNMRQNVGFYFFSNSTAFPVLVATAPQQVNFVNPNQPSKARVMPTGNPDSQILLWSSLNSTQPVVRWGTVAGGPYPNVIAANTTTLPQNWLCGGWATGIGWHDLGLIHSATLTGLTPYAKSAIYYVFGDAATSNWASEHVFYLPPLPGDSSLPTVMITYGDLGRGTPDEGQTWYEYGRASYNTTDMLAALEIAAMKGRGNGYTSGYKGQWDSDVRSSLEAAGAPEGSVQGSGRSLVASGAALSPTAGMHFLHHLGDISYATGYLAVWDMFLDMLSPTASTIPYAISLGNHEADWPNSDSYWNTSDSGGECSIATLLLMPLPLPKPYGILPQQQSAPLATGAGSTRSLIEGAIPGLKTPWYSMEVGMIHLIALSSEHNFTTGSLQWQWLQADLQAVNRSVTPWVIASIHRPMYIDSTYGGPGTPVTADQTVALLLRQHLEPLFFQYRVNVGLYGHNHAVQRLSAAYGDTQYIQRSVPVTQADGNVWWTHDNPQATLHLVIGTGGADFTINNQPVPPPWSENVFFRYGYSRITAVNATVLQYEWVDNTNHSVMDRVILTQSANLTAPWVLPAANPSNGSNGLPSGATAGIVIAVLLVVGIVAVVIWRFRARASGGSAGAQRAMSVDGFYMPGSGAGSTAGRVGGAYAPLQPTV